MTPVGPLRSPASTGKKNADVSIPAPKGHRPPRGCPFHLHTGYFLGTVGGAKIAFMDPYGAGAAR
jgi:hypothetical protein